MRGVVAGADLSQMTGKVVREKVLEVLGDRAGDDQRAIKRSVRDALKVVLTDVSTPPRPKDPSSPVSKPQLLKPAAAGTTPGKAAPAEKTRPGVKEAEGDRGVPPSAQEKGSEATPAGRSLRRLRRLAEGSSPEAQNGKGAEEDEFGSDPEGEIHPKPSENGVEGDGDVTDDVPADKESDPPAEIPDMDESDHDADDENFQPQRAPRGRPKKRRNKALKDAKDDISEDDMERATKAKGTEDRQARGSSPKAPRAKRVRRARYKTENDLTRLKKLCRQLGCRGAAFRAIGKTPEEKCTSLLDFLSTKGVNDISSLTQKDIEAHRARLENEAEVAGLDTRSVCSPFPSIIVSIVHFCL